jgi:hypothetical protein
MFSKSDTSHLLKDTLFTLLSFLAFLESLIAAPLMLLFSLFGGDDPAASHVALGLFMLGGVMIIPIELLLLKITHGERKYRYLLIALAFPPVVFFGCYWLLTRIY